MADFDQKDLDACMEHIQRKMHEEQTMRALLETQQQQLDALVSCQDAMMKALTLLAQHGSGLEKSLTRLHTGVAGLHKALAQGASLAKSSPAPAPARVPTESLADTAAKGVVAKALLMAFGQHGGHALKYDKHLATRMLGQQLLSAKEHEVWKRTGRVPDRCWAQLQRVQ